MDAGDARCTPPRRAPAPPAAVAATAAATPAAGADGATPCGMEVGVARAIELVCIELPNAEDRGEGKHAFWLHGVLSDAECRAAIAAAEARGFDQALVNVGGGRQVRHSPPAPRKARPKCARAGTTTMASDRVVRISNHFSHASRSGRRTRYHTSGLARFHVCARGRGMQLAAPFQPARVGS